MQFLSVDVIRVEPRVFEPLDRVVFLPPGNEASIERDVDHGAP